MKKILCILILVMVMITSGCEQKVKYKSEDGKVGVKLTENTSESIDKLRNNRKKVPCEQLIEDDIKNNGLNIFNLNYIDEELEVSFLEILKRKSDLENGYDTVDISLELENEDYIVTTEYTICYSFYDVGGWIIDNCFFYWSY